MQATHSPGARLSVVGVMKTVLTAALALVGLGLFLAWMGGAFHEKVPPGVVDVERPRADGRTIVTAERTRGLDTVSVVGSVQPRRKSEISSQILATIRSIPPRSGERIKTGDTLVTLDDRELLAQQREAMANLASAEADLVTRKADYERIKMLRATGSVSMEEVTRIEGAFRVAESQATRAKEAIARIDVLVTYTQIKATSDGVVADRLAEPGDVAAPGRTLLTVYDPTDLELHVNVPESLAAGVTLGQEVEIRIDANNWQTVAKVLEIIPQAEQVSRSVLMKLGLPVSTSVPVLPGMFGRATIPVGQVERIWLPSPAIQHIGQLDMVEVALDDGTLSRRFVRTGRTLDGRTEMLSGISAGERVALPVTP